MKQVSHAIHGHYTPTDDGDPAKSPREVSDQSKACWGCDGRAVQWQWEEIRLKASCRESTALDILSAYGHQRVCSIAAEAAWNCFNKAA